MFTYPVGLLNPKVGADIPTLNLVGWYKSTNVLILDVNDVREWHDQSGNDMHLIQEQIGGNAELTANELNGYPAIIISVSPYTPFVSNKNVGFTGEYSQIIVYSTSGTSNLYRPAGMSANPTASANFHPANDGSIRFDNGALTGSAIPQNTYFIRTSTINDDVETNDYYNETSNINNIGLNPNINDGTFDLIAGSTASPAKFVEMLVYNRVLTSIELQQIWDYLNNKYSIY